MAVFNVKGLIAPVFTPVHEDGALNLSVIPEYAQYLRKNEVDGILVGGTTGEATSLRVGERTQLLEAWVTEAKPLGLKVIAQVGGTNLADVKAMAQHAETLKVDAVMTLPELYFKPKTVEQLVGYLEEVSRAAPSLPLVYYHFPMMSGVDVNVADFFKLASSRIANFKGIKADLGIAVQVAELLGPDQRVFIANHLLAPSALLGHDSSIATVTNLFPELVRQVVQSTNAGDVTRARELQERLNRLVATISSHGDFVPSTKACMALVTGVRVGAPRGPQQPLSAQRVASLAERLRGMGVRLADE